MKTLIFIGTFAEGDRLDRAYSYQNNFSPVLSGIEYTTNLWHELSKRYDVSIAIANFPCTPYPYSKAKKIDDDFWDKKRLSSSYLNRRYIRNISAKNQFLNSIKKHLIPYLKNFPCDNEITIFLCDPWSPLVEVSIYLKKIFKKARLVVDLPDLPYFTNRMNKNIVFRFFKYLNSNQVVHYLDKNADSFVFFSKNMCKFFNLSNRKFIVHQGLINPISLNFDTKQNEGTINIVYTGSLDEKASNASLMIKAVELLNKKNNSKKYNLYLAGGGYDEKDFAISNPNIHYLGQLSSKETKKLQLSADILISLRPNTQEFNFAFPSKMFEYIECRRPIVCVLLDCFPDIISKYCYLVEKVDIDSIITTIESISFEDFYKNRVPTYFHQIVKLYSAETLAEAICSL